MFHKPKRRQENVAQAVTSVADRAVRCSALSQRLFRKPPLPVRAALFSELPDNVPAVAFRGQAEVLVRGPVLAELLGAGIIPRVLVLGES